MKKKRKKKIRPRSRKRTGKKRMALKRKAGKRRTVRKRKHRVARKRTHKKRIVRKVRIKKPARSKKKRAARSKKPVARRTVARRSARRSVRKPPVQKPVLALNTDFEFFYELRDLVLKSSPAEKDRMVERLNKLGRVKLAIISGVFINKENLDPLITDLLIVGDDVDRRKLRAFLRATEAEVGKEIKFTVMDKEEFQYRLAMFDRFTRVLLESPHEKLINRLGI
jgi:hypothetical protein